jgi:hypothetical protein
LLILVVVVRVCCYEDSVRRILPQSRRTTIVETFTFEDRTAPSLVEEISLSFSSTIIQDRFRSLFEDRTATSVVVEFILSSSSSLVNLEERTEIPEEVLDSNK